MQYYCRERECPRHTCPFPTGKALCDHIRDVHHSPDLWEQDYAEIGITTLRRCQFCSQLFWGAGGLHVHQTRSAACRDAAQQSHDRGARSAGSLSSGSRTQPARAVRARPVRVPVAEAEIDEEDPVVVEPAPGATGEADVIGDVDFPADGTVCPAVYKLQPSLVGPFQQVFVKGVRGDRETRRRKRLLLHLAGLDDPCAATLTEVRRLKLLQPQGVPGPRAEHRLPVRRIEELVDAGCAGKALRRLEGHVQGGVVQFSEEVRATVEQLYPRGREGLPAFEGDQPAPLVISAAELLETVAAAPRMSAAGLSGWTYDLIRIVVSDELAAAVSAKLLTLMAAGRLGQTELWLKSRLVLLPKPSGGVRPLSIGEAWTRMLGRALAKRFASRVAAVLSPLQLGIGVRGGVELCAHALQAAAKAVRAGGTVMQSIDSVNAFNTVSRLAVAREVDAHVPELSALVRWSYGGASPLCDSDGSVVTDVTSGVRQGDPLGPLFFALALQPVLTEVKAAHAAVDVLAYLDDVHLVGPPDAVMEAFHTFEVLAGRVGLVVNPHKSHTLDADDEGMLAVGVPVGKAQFVHDTMATLLREKADVLPLLGGLHPRIALALLRQCVSARPMYWARTLPPAAAEGPFAEFDLRIDGVLATLCNRELTVLTGVGRHIRHLPAYLGGLGVRRFDSARRLCWAASFGAALPFLREHVRSAQMALTDDAYLDPLRQYLPVLLEEPRPLDQNVVGATALPTCPRQRDLLKTHDKTVLETVVASCSETPYLQAWLTSSACPESSTWLAAGKSKIGQLAADEFRLALCLKLLQPVVAVPEGGRLRCFCDRFDDADPLALAVHAVGCTSLSEMRSARHNDMRDAIAGFLRSLRSGAQVNTEVVLARPGDRHTSTRLRSDVAYHLQHDTKHIDVSVVSPCTDRAMELNAASTPAVAAAEAERNKRRQYQVALTSAGLSQEALLLGVFETSGRPGPQLASFLAWLRNLPATQDADEDKVSSLVRDLTCIIWRWNARLLRAVFVNRSPLLQRPEDA